MKKTSRVLSDLILNIYNSSSKSRDIRLIVPGFTKTISGEIHQYLLGEGITSLLAINPAEDNPDPNKSIYSYNEITSVRFGSFVLICAPGVLPLLQDSIKSPGAPIKDLALNEEWPWKKLSLEGLEWKTFLKSFFSLTDIVCEDLVKNLFKCILDAFETVEPSKREILFFEEVLNFDLPINSLNEIKQLFKAIGIPNYPIFFENINKETIIKNYTEKYIKVNKFIKDIYKGDFTRSIYLENFEQIKDKYPLITPENVDQFFDCLSDQLDEIPDFLMHSKFFKEFPLLWEAFSIPFLEDLFQIPQGKKGDIKIIEATIIDRTIQTISSGNNQIVIFNKERILLNFTIEPHEFEFPMLKVFRGSEEKKSFDIKTDACTFQLEFDPHEDLGRIKPKKALKVVFNLFDGNINTGSKVEIQLVIVSENRPGVFFYTDHKEKFIVTDFKKQEDHDDDDEIAIQEVNGLVKCYIMTFASSCIIDLIPNDFRPGLEIVDNNYLYQYPAEGQGMNIEDNKEGTFQVEATTEKLIHKVILSSLIDEEKGYSIFDEIITTIKRGKKEDAKRIIEAIEKQIAYKKGLGKKTVELIKRGGMADLFENYKDAFPLLVYFNKSKPLLPQSSNKEFYIMPTGIKVYSDQDIEVFPKLLVEGGPSQISPKVIQLLENYHLIRFKLIENFRIPFENEKLDRPLYACSYFFDPSNKNILKNLLKDYLVAYADIMELLQKNGDLNSFEKFLLTHLDCVAIFDESREEKIFLLGPWHPFNLFSAISLFSITVPLLQRLINKGKFTRNINSLVSIIDKNEPIKWLSYFSISESEFEKALCFTTNDFGWKAAVCVRDSINFKGLGQYLSFLNENYSFEVHLPNKGINESLAGYVRNYYKSNPTVRKVWINLNKDYEKSAVFETLKKDIYPNHDFARLIPGGIHCIFPNGYSVIEEPKSNYDEKLQFYFYTSNQNLESQVDLNILQPYDEVKLTKGEDSQVRGKDEFVIFREPIYEIKIDGDGLPISKIFEHDSCDGDSSSLSDVFLKISSIHTRIKDAYSLNIKTNFSLKDLNSNWTILPSTSIDPKILHHNLIEAMENGALWDYKLRFDDNFLSYYILTEIPTQLIERLISSNFFIGKSKDDISKIINEISRMGISIGKEALSSTNKLYGTVGFIGSILCLNKSLEMTEKSVGFLISVDSFQPILDPEEKEENNSAKYADLLAFQLQVKDNNVIISFSSIESKFSKERISDSRFNHALDQSRVTAETIESLIKNARSDDGILERIALKEIVFYGLRSKQVETPLYKEILERIINGQIQYCKASYPQIVIVTSGIEEEKRVIPHTGNLLRINLSPSFWPTNDEFALAEIEALFSKCMKAEIKPILVNQELENKKEIKQTELGIHNNTGKGIDTETNKDTTIDTDMFFIPKSRLEDVIDIESSFEPLNLNKISIDERYQKIDTIYSYFIKQNIGVKKIPIEEVSFIEAPSFYRIEIKYDDVNAFEKIQGKLTVINILLKLPHGLHARVYYDKGDIWLEVPKMDYQKIPVKAEEYLWPNFKRNNQLRIPFGVDNDGGIISINLSSSKSPHFLIAGKTGSGKSVLLDTIIRGAAKFYSPDELHLFMIDPKGTELIEFEELKHTREPNGRSSEDAIKLLGDVIIEMDRRYEAFTVLFHKVKKKIKDIYDYNEHVENKLPWWLIILDEYADLVEMDKSLRKEIESQLQRLASKARASGIHIIIATQRPSADIFNSTMKSNIPGVIALSANSSTNSRIILDETGAELLSGKGEALFKGDQEGGLIRVQCAISKG